jgi:MoxR-like ATPase
VDAAEVQALAQRIRREVGKAVVGQAGAVDLLLVALLVRGHVLLEGPPGVAKTLLVRAFGRALGLSFGRVQFTPDLTPGDILGANLFNFQTSAFTLSKGPIFTELLLADEVNRSPPKTQAALLEAMQERHVTLDGVSHPLSDRFLVVATQNPVESQGVYPLPEAQLDRFLFKAVLGYPGVEEEREIVAGHGARTGSPEPEALGVEPACAAAVLAAASDAAARVRLSPEIVDYVVALVRATRDSPEVAVGASPRGGAMLAAAARARALLDGRDYAVPDDVKALAAPALRHRLILSAAAEMDGRRVEQVLEAVIARIEAPR